MLHAPLAPCLLRLSLAIVCHSTTLSFDLFPRITTLSLCLSLSLFLLLYHSLSSLHLPLILSASLPAPSITLFLSCCALFSFTFYFQLALPVGRGLRGMEALQSVVPAAVVAAVVAADYSHRLAFVKFHELALFTTWVALPLSPSLSFFFLFHCLPFCSALILYTLFSALYCCCCCYCCHIPQIALQTN